MPDMPGRALPITLEIAAGELVDKLTILEIKAARILDPAKLANVTAELAAVQAAFVRSVARSPELDALIADLRSVNERIWDVEDQIRACERSGDFGPPFIELAREVRWRNDHRAAIKRQINDHLGSRFIEEKSYPD